MMTMSEEEITEEETTEEEAEITKEMEEAAQRMYLSEIMRQLSNSERFKRFFAINYDVQTYFDKEAQTFDIRLIELPPELASRRLGDLATKHVEAHTPIVETATMADVAAMNDFAKLHPDVDKKK
jgi:hypothetical protein